MKTARGVFGSKAYSEFDMVNANAYAFASYNEKMKYLFPNGIPTSAGEVGKYIVTVAVPITTKDGEKKTQNVRIHRALADELVYVLQMAQYSGFKAYEVQGYVWRSARGSDVISMHALGCAVDINTAENPMLSLGQVDYWRERTNEYSILEDGILVYTFKSIGWGWGGDWKTKKDFMHFSYTGL